MSEARTAAGGQLEAVYGGPSESGFGSAVFRLPAADTADDLDAAAEAIYRRFVGDAWKLGGDDAWMGPWKCVYERAAGTEPAIVAELRGIDDQAAKGSIPLLMDLLPDPGAAEQALSAAFDEPGMAAVRVYNIGDGAAMSGIILAGEKDTGERVFVTALLD